MRSLRRKLQMSKTALLTVYYDGACPICRREIAYYQRQKAVGSIDWVDANKNPEQLRTAGITTAKALARLHAITADGEIVSGPRAFQKIWQAFPKFRFLANCLNFYPLQLLFGYLYEKFLNYRPSLQKLLRRRS